MAKARLAQRQVGRAVRADTGHALLSLTLDSLKNWAARGATHPGALQWRTVREFSPRAKRSVKSRPIWCRFHLREPNEREHKATRLPYELQTPTSDTLIRTPRVLPSSDRVVEDRRDEHAHAVAGEQGQHQVHPAEADNLGVALPKKSAIRSTQRDATRRNGER